MARIARIETPMLRISSELPAKMTISKCIQLWRIPLRRVPERWRATRFVLLCLVFLRTASPARAVEPDRHISQYSHTAWRVLDGAFTGSPNAIAQAAGGYLWIGTSDGLFRFDGVRFVRWVSPDKAQLPSAFIFHLLGASDGSLWIGANGGVSHLVNDHLVKFPDVERRDGVIFQDHDGGIWISRSRGNPLCHLLGSTMKCYGNADGIPFTQVSAEPVIDALGNFWIGSDTAFLRWKPGSSTLYTPGGLKHNAGMMGVSAFAPEPDGSVWAATTFPGPGMGLQHLIQGGSHPLIVGSFDSSSLEVRTLFLDSHHALWIGTTHKGIYRIRAGNVDHFDSADGLSGNEVIHFLEDSEGSMWTVTSGGIDKFSDLSVATYSTTEGITTTEVDAVVAAHNGTVWVGGADALNSIRDDKVSSVQGLLGKQIASLFEDDKSRLWVGINDTLTIYEKGKFREIKRPDGSSFGMISDIAEDKNKDLWVSAGGPHRALLRLHDDKVQQQFPALFGRVAADPSGSIWLGTKTGNLVRFQDGHTDEIDFKHDHASRVEQVMVDSDGSVLGATALGVIAWKNGLHQMMTVRNGLPCDNIFALVKDDEGDLWLYTQCGLVEISAPELQRWWHHSDSSLKARVFDEFNGVRPGLAPFQKAARAPDGRLWFANNVLLQMIDPHHLYENPTPPPVHIEAVFGDRKRYTPVPNLRLPSLTRDFEIDYTALSFMVPQRVRFRYKLEGHDIDWQDPGTRRQAFYNDLPPGTFTFHVLACNNDGVWNEVGASLTFLVAPAWFQTTWFRILWMATTCLLFWTIYRLRVRSIAKALSARFDERLDERTRMALELHDTFLQTVQGSKMVADDALDLASDQLRMRHALERLSLWLGQAVTEGRAALHALRVSTTERNHLAEFLDRSAKEHCQRASISVALTVIGDAVDLHPIVRDEFARIAEEGIRNACLHSKASQLSIELRYARDLSLSLKDNGVGIDPEIADTGKPGHFGIQGMKERSARIRARITITSTLNKGTHITLVVPGNVVYRREKKTLLRRLRESELWRNPSIDSVSKTKERTPTEGE